MIYYWLNSYKKKKEKFLSANGEQPNRTNGYKKYIGENKYNEENY